MPAEVPDEGRPLQPPVIPLAVVADIAFLVKGERAFFQTALFLEALQHLFAVFLAIGFEQTRQGFLHFFELVFGHVRAWQPGSFAAGPLEFDGGFRRTTIDEGLHLLFAAENRVDLVRDLGLVPEDVAGMVDLLVELGGACPWKIGPPSATCEAPCPSSRMVICRPVMTNSNLSVPGWPKIAQLSPAPDGFPS